MSQSPKYFGKRAHTMWSVQNLKKLARMSQSPKYFAKRAHTMWPEELKANAVARVLNGETKAAVSRDTGIPESTLRGWCKSRRSSVTGGEQLAIADISAGVTIPAMQSDPEERMQNGPNAVENSYPNTAMDSCLLYNWWMACAINKLYYERIRSEYVKSGLDTKIDDEPLDLSVRK